MRPALYFPFRTSFSSEAIARIVLVATILATIALAPAARAQLKASASVVKELDAVLALVSFDHTSRTVALQGAGGIDLSFTVPPDVHMFERLRPGELFSMRYTLSRTHELNKSGVAGVSEAQAREFDLAGDRLVGRLSNTKRLSLRVQAVDQESRTLALRDANDTVLTVAVDDDDQGFDQIAPGDIVTIMQVESIVLEILLPAESDRFGAAPLSN